jgi:hypothetical protein
MGTTVTTDYRRRYYRRNRAREIAQASKSRDASMDLDHVRGQKRCDLSQAAAAGLSLKSVEAEIAKCDVVCANCHRIRTHERRA